MLTGQGLIGKLVYFLATKLLGRQIDLSLDDKKRACRAFVELYYCIDKLEDITSHFLTELGEVKKSTECWKLVNQFAIHGRSIDALSQRFFDIGAELNRAVELYDPDLAEAVNQLYLFKFSFLSFVSNSIELVEKDGERNRLLKYVEPSSRVLSIDMESYYDWVKANRGKKITEPNRVDWPANMLAFSLFGEDFPEVVIEVADIDAIGRFRKVLANHGATLTSAREKLREFIVANFNIEDVLYVSRKMPHQEL